ncbi:MAG: hypothetical protein RLZZ515_1396 [Cyanobacteriota bacterium]
MTHALALPDSQAFRVGAMLERERTLALLDHLIQRQPCQRERLVLERLRDEITDAP